MVMGIVSLMFEYKTLLKKQRIVVYSSTFVLRSDYLYNSFSLYFHIIIHVIKPFGEIVVRVTYTQNYYTTFLPNFQ